MSSVDLVIACETVSDLCLIFTTRLAELCKPEKLTLSLFICTFKDGELFC